GAGAGGGGPGLVPRRASPEPGPAGVGVVRGGADPAVCATAPVVEEGSKSGRDRGVGGAGCGSTRRRGGVAGDRLPDPAFGSGSAAVRLLPMSGRAAGERSDREHDPAGAQPAAEGDEPVLGGVQRGGGDSTPSGGVVGPVGGANGADAGGHGEGPADRLGLGPTGMFGGVESAGRGGRRIGATIKEGTI